MTDWLAYFTLNRARATTIPWERGLAVEPALRGPLARSLQRFQVGESGDGRHLRQAARTTRDAAYAAALDLFIAEENKHAGILGRLLQGLGAAPLPRHWSDNCFICVRHLGGLYGELLVLLVAEIIGERFYRLVYARGRDVVLRGAMAELLDDEAGHLAFHCDTLRDGLAPLPAPVRAATHGGWWLFFHAVCAIVILDHRPFLSAIGVGPVTFWRDCAERATDATARIFATRPSPMGSGDYAVSAPTGAGRSWPDAAA
jgi:hypothetical protein